NQPAAIARAPARCYSQSISQSDNRQTDSNRKPNVRLLSPHHLWGTTIMATTTQPIIRKELILTNHEQWDTWMLSLRSKVDRYNLWPYLDPDAAAANVPKLVQPTRPTYATVKQGATKIADLSAEERLELSELRAIYLEDQRLFTKQWEVYHEL